MIGNRVGNYEITAKLGEGRMGVVYRAKDLQLGREVALKFLPAEFTEDPERVNWLEREGRLLASLNHPNIAQIYGFHTSGETRALVMELVEGPTLAEFLAGAILPLPESLSIAIQIVQALTAAHVQGIVHRGNRLVQVGSESERPQLAQMPTLRAHRRSQRVGVLSNKGRSEAKADATCEQEERCSIHLYLRGF